jgi:MoxR-like ATPase
VSTGSQEHPAPPAGSSAFASPDDVRDRLFEARYVAGRGLATAVFVSTHLGMPLLVEGEPGVGKTELSKAIGGATGRRLIRLQCYEGIDAAAALYEWDYPRQLLHLRAAGPVTAESDVFSERFLLSRPLLDALRTGDQGVLLVDEVDRADEAFEAFLLEFLADFQITIPELGTVTAASRPIVILTSNRTRDLHDALRRRCVYHWIDYPTVEQEVDIIRLRAPDLPARLVADTAAIAAALRELDLFKAPGVSETLAWARALGALGNARVAPEAAMETLGTLVKDRDDIGRVVRQLEGLIRRECDA